MELYALKDLSSSGSDLQEVDIYYLEKLIHKGKGCTRLLEAQAPDSDEPLAIKLFPKKTGGQVSEGFTNEERLLSDLSHPHLAKYHKLYRDALIKGKNEEFSQYSAITMEYISSKDLFNVISNGAMTEKLARTVLKQILSVMEYLHNQNLAYLDLKLENFLVNKDGIKLIDLEGCRDVRSKLRGEAPQGTCGYRAPELMNGECDDGKAVDMYALGVVLFTLVAGTPPYTEYADYKENKFDQYYNALRKDKSKFWKAHEHYRVNDHQEPFSKEFKQVVEAMLEENAMNRWTIDEIKRSQWMKGETCSKEELMRGLGFSH